MPGSGQLMRVLGMAICLLGLAACGGPQAAEGPVGEPVAAEDIHFRIRKSGEGILVIRLDASGLYGYIMNETAPRRLEREDLPRLVQQYAASRKEKGSPEAYNIDADEDMPYPEVGKLMTELRAIGVEKFTLSAGILTND